MVKTKNAMTLLIAIIITAMMFAGSIDPVSAAPQQISGDFKNPARGIRLEGKYANSLDRTDDTVITLLKGTRVANDSVEGIFTNFDKDYNANRVDQPGSAYDGFMNGSSPIVEPYSQYEKLLHHIKGDAGYEKWHMFNLENANNTKGNIKIKVANLKHYNGRDKKYERLDAVITITDWKKADSGSALVDNIVVEHQSAWNERGGTYRYGTGDDKTPDWKKSENGTTPAGNQDYKHEYQRADSKPYVIMSITDAGLPGIRVARLEYLKYKVEFFEAGTVNDSTGSGTVKSIATNVSGTDIDTGQEVHMTPRDSDNVSYYAVSPNTHFDMPVYSNGSFDFVDKKTPYENRDNDEGDAFAIYYEGNQYSMKFVSGYGGNGGYSYFAQKSAPSVFYIPEDPVKTIGVSGEDDEETHDGRSDSTRTSRGINSGDTPAQKWSKVRSLTRDQLVDDEGHSTLRDAVNTVFNRKITFKIRHVVGSDYNEYNKFKKYRIKDTFDPAFEILTEGDDAPKMVGRGSSNFTVTQSGQYIEANAIDPKHDSLYGGEHVLVVKAKLKKEMFDLYGGTLKLADYINSEGRVIAVPNTAQVVIDDDGPDWTDKQTDDPTGNQFVKSTDTTFATVVMPKPLKQDPPEKYVADNDDRKLISAGNTATGQANRELYDLLGQNGLTENTLDNPVNEYTYYIANTLDRGYVPCWYFKSYEITDSLEEQPLSIVKGSAKVHRLNWTGDFTGSKSYTKPANSDATSDFDISYSEDGKTISAKAKSSALNNAAFYRSSDNKACRYILEFRVKIDPEQFQYGSDIEEWFDASVSAGDSKGYTWKNYANLRITDNYDPDLTQDSEEQADEEWDIDTNETKTHIFTPRFDVTKTADPYEFQVGDVIPYTIKIKNIEKNTTAGWVEGIDDDLPEDFEISEVTASGGTDPKAEFDDGILKISALKLPYNEELVTKFEAVPESELNGSVIPNTAYARAWGIEEDDDHENWDAKAATSVYINSPKLDITKECDKKPDKDGNITLNKGDTIHFKSRIKNINPGTFMRNIYAVDVVETDGLTIKPGTIKVRVNSRTDSERMINVDDPDEGKAYKVEPFANGETSVVCDNNLGGRLGSLSMDDYEIETSEEKAENTGNQLPADVHGGFIIKFLGKYRNMGYQDKTIPATDDDVFDKVRGKAGKDVIYMKGTEMEAVENEQVKYGSAAYTKDYDNLNLQNLIEISYDCEVTDEGLTKIGNFIRVPATENSNNDMINNDDSVPTGGDFAYTGDTLTIEPPGGDTDKKADEETADKDAVIHYTVSGENTGSELIKDPELEDELVTRNLVFNKDSFEVFRNEPDNDNKLSSEEYELVFDDEKYSFKIKVPGADLKKGEKIIVKYSGIVTKNIKTTDPNNRRLQELTDEEVVHNKVAFMGKTAHVWTPNSEPEEPNPRLTKTVHENSTQIGGVLHYTIVGENVSGMDARDVVFKDEIKTKNLEYDRNSFEIKFINGSDKTETDLTSELVSKIEFTDDTFILPTGKDLKKGDKITIKYSGKVKGSENEENKESEGEKANGTDEVNKTSEEIEGPKSVDNVVVMTGSNFDSLQDQKKVPFGKPNISKTAQVPYTVKGKSIPYIAEFTNIDDEVWRNVILTDEISTKNAVYNKDFRIFIDKEDITNDCRIDYSEFSAVIKTGKDIAKGQTIRAEYSVTTTNGEWVDNEFIVEDADGRNAHAFETVPPVTHEKTVDKPEHDGPDGERNVLNYTLTSKHNGKDRPLKNVVITDTVLSKNLVFNNDIKVVKSGNDITKDCKISMAEDRMSFEIRLKDPLSPGETVITTYSGKVTNMQQVDNETIMKADGIKGIKAGTSVPGPKIKPESPAPMQKKVKITKKKTANKAPEKTGSLKHKKRVAGKYTSRGKNISYTLTTLVSGHVNKVVITDEVLTKNYKYDEDSLKVYLNGEHITKKTDIGFEEHSFVIKTNRSFKDGDKIVVTYRGIARDGKKIENLSTARADNIKPVRSKAVVRPLKKSDIKKGSEPKTSDPFIPHAVGIVMILAALICMISIFARGRKS